MGWFWEGLEAIVDFIVPAVKGLFSIFNVQTMLIILVIVIIIGVLLVFMPVGQGLLRSVAGVLGG